MMKAMFKRDGQYYEIDGDTMAKYLLKPKEERDTELTYFMVTQFAEGCHQMANKNLEEIDSPIIFQGLKQAREILYDYSRPLVEKQKNLEKEIEELEYKIWQIEEKEHDNYMKAHDLSCQLDKLGLFHGAEKKALKEQIEALRKPLEVPTEYNQKIEMHKVVIEGCKENLKHYDNLIRGCNWAEQELLLKGKNCKTSEKPQKAQKSQKEEKAINTKPTTKQSFKDQMKPLKSIK